MMKHYLMFPMSRRFSSSFSIVKIDRTRRVHRYLDDIDNNMASRSSKVKDIFAFDNFQGRNSITCDIKRIEICGVNW